MPTETEFPALLADLGFSLDVPDGFADPGTPHEDVDFENSVVCAPLVLLASPVATAIITVMARPAYETGSVLQWLRFLTNFHGLTLSNVRSGTIGKGGRHPAILADAEQDQEGMKLRLTMVAIEDGGRFVMAQGLCPAELWPSYGEAMTRAVRSLSLTRPQGPKYDLDSTTAIGWKKEDAATPESYEKHVKEQRARLEPAVEKAAGLLQREKFEEAEAVVAAVDSSIQGSVAIARMYEEHLRALVKSGAARKDKERIERVFLRALSWAQNCYPDPHTQIEAENYEAGRAQDRARLVGVLGYEPAP